MPVNSMVPAIEYILNQMNCPTLRKILDLVNQDIYISKPKDMRYDIPSTGEKAAQRAILKPCGETLLRFFVPTIPATRIAWIDGELPVKPLKGRRRGKSFDLIGRRSQAVSNSSTAIDTICEIKYSENNHHSNTPLYAAIEVLCYACVLENNKNKGVVLSLHNNANAPNGTYNIATNCDLLIIVAANESYWKYWNRPKGYFVPEELSKAKPNSKGVNIPALFDELRRMCDNKNIYAFQFSDPEPSFIDQKINAGNGRYRPSGISTTWDQIA